MKRKNEKKPSYQGPDFDVCDFSTFAKNVLAQSRNGVLCTVCIAQMYRLLFFNFGIVDDFIGVAVLLCYFIIYLCTVKYNDWSI